MQQNRLPIHPMIRTVIFVFITLAAAAFQENQRWSKVSSAEGRFSVLMPGRATSEVEKNDFYVTHSFTADTDWATYLVAYTDYKKLFTDPELALDGARDALIQSTNSQLLSESKIMIDGYLGRELHIITSGGIGKDTTRLYIVRNRLYAVRVVVAPANLESAKDKERFFSSFRLIATLRRPKRS